MERAQGPSRPSLRLDLGGNVSSPGEPGVETAPKRSLPLLGKKASRRGFLKFSGAAGLSLAAACLLDSMVKTGVVSAQASVIVANAQGVLVTDPTRCVGCRRCELACTEFNKGKSQPSIANIKIVRNMNYGPKMAYGGFATALGVFGNHRVIQDTCKQCPHPVPCATTCPVGAIVADPATGARVVNEAACIGCKFCQMSCPWEMMSFDEETMKAQKCHLCGGNSQCAEACPTGAVKYVAWTDLTKSVPARVAISGLTRPAATAAACGGCHPAVR